MGNSQDNQQALLKQGVEWLKFRKDSLAEKLATEMANAPGLPGHQLPSFLRKLIAKDMLQDLIKRLESNSFDVEEVRKKMLSGLKKGATIQSLVVSVNLMEAVIITQAQQELADRPLVLASVLNKTTYFATLLKSTIANAVIENEKQKSYKP